MNFDSPFILYTPIRHLLEYLILMENPTKNPIAGPMEILNGNLDGKSGNDFILALSLKKDTTKFSLVYMAFEYEILL